jgi:Dolichyl-phosphate-mannose-protein mannosyltransferase
MFVLPIHRAPSFQFHVPLALVGGGFVLSRLILFKLGIRLNMYPLGNYWQHIDPVLLRERLLESLFYLHSQPPLFNLFLGSVQKLDAGHDAIAFTVIYTLMGLLLAITMYRLATRLGVGRWLACALTLGFLVSPACIYFENFLTYTYPITLLLCGAALTLHRFFESRRMRDGLVSFALMAALVLTRSMFQIIWFVLVLVALLLQCPAEMRRRVCLGAALPLALVCALYLKNFLVFGTFTTSSWFGMNFLRVVTFQLPPEEREAWIAQGIMPPLVALGTFNSVEAYRPYLPYMPRTGIPLLDEERTSTGQTNYHHVAYVAIGAQCAGAAARMIRERPSLYVKGLLSSASIFFWPPTDERYGATEALSGRFALLKSVYNRLVYGQLTAYAPNPTLEDSDLRHLGNLAKRIGWFVFVGYPLLIAYGVTRVKSDLSSGERAGTPMALLFMLTSMLYITAVGIGFEVGENNGFRFLVDPFVFTLLGLWIGRVRWSWDS